MNNLFTKILFKSFLSFSLSLISAWIRIEAPNSLGWLHRLLPLEEFITNPQPKHPNSEGHEDSFEKLPFKMTELANPLETEALNNYMWYMAVIMILEIVIFAYSLIEKRLKKKFRHTLIHQKQQKISVDPSQHVDSIQKSLEPKLKQFILCIAKTVLLYSLCYFLYMMLFIALYFACNIDIHQQKKLSQQEIAINKQNPRVLQEDYQTSSDQEEAEGMENNTSESLTSTALNPVVGQVLFRGLFTDTMSINSMVISNDGDTAFMAITEEELQTESCYLLIYDISTPTMPSHLATLSFPGSAGSLLLSSDEKTAFLSTVFALQIIDVSNTASPVNISLVPSPANTTLASFFLSPDDQAIYMAYSLTQQEGSYIQIMNISHVYTPQPGKQFLNFDNSYFYYDLAGVYGESLYAQNGVNMVIYNISDAQNPIQIANMTLPVESNQSYQVDYYCYQQFIYIFTSEENMLQIANISNNTISVISPQIPLPPLNDPDVVQSPDGIHIFVTGGEYLLIFDVSDPTNPISLPEPNFDLPPSNSIVIFSHGNLALTNNGDSFCIIQLNIDVQVTQAFSITNNILQIVNITNFTDSTETVQQMVVSPDGNRLYISSENSTLAPNNSLVVIDVSNPNSCSFGPSIKLEQGPSQIVLSSDGETLFTMSELNNGSYYEFGIYNMSDDRLVSSFMFENLDFSDDWYVPGSFAITPNEDMAFIIQSQTNFLILNISGRANNLSIVSNTSLDFNFTGSVMLSTDGRTAFLVGYDNSQLGSLSALPLYMYDISTPSLPRFLPPIDGLPYLVSGLALSPDGNTAFIFTSVFESADRECTLNIVNISSLDAPVVITTIYLIDSCLAVEPIVIPMLPNGQVIVVPLLSSLVVYDVSNLLFPNLIDYYEIPQASVKTSPDYSTLFIASQQTVTTVNLKPDYILYLESNTVSMGAIYQTSLNLLTKNSQATYDARLLNYKFTNIFLYTPGFYSPSLFYTTLPDWTTFDTDTGIITFSPNSLSQLWTISISGTLSTQMSNSTFLGVGSINNTNDSLDLLVALVGLGYVDNEGYLTSSFNPTQPLLLSSQYEGNEFQIRNTLAKYYIQAFTSVYIVSSLALSLPDSPSSPFSLSTLSQELLNVMISLWSTSSQPMFVSTGFSSTGVFSNNNSVLTMVKSLTDANTAFSELIIYLNGSESCNGNITASDGLNPTLIQFIPNISQYFKINSPPSVNISYLQSQVATVSPKTGQQFSLSFNSATFIDSNNQSLTLALKMQDSSLQVPQWLELNGFSLIGTPPDQLTGRELELTLVVSNQYQSTQVSLTLDVDISLDYALKLSLTYGSVALTIIGLYVYAPTLYNILCKRRYIYSKDFTIRIGQEIDFKSLYPIVFASESLAESRLIMQHLDQKTARTINNKSKTQIAAFFINSETNQIDKSKLIQEIEETAADIQKSAKSELKLYSSEIGSKKKFISDIITNSFIMRLLNLQQEESTKMVFDRIKNKLFSFVDLDRYQPDEELYTFFVNETKLHAELQDCNIVPFPQVNENQEQEVNIPSSQPLSNVNAALDSSSSQESLKSLEVELLLKDSNRSSINMDLLTAAIEAYAYNHHIIDANIADVNIIAKRRLPKIRLFECIRRFLKRDLQPIGYSGKGVIGYGIEYWIRENTLSFCGTAADTLKDMILVVQIVNLKGKILRELWIYGVDGEPDRNLSIL